MTATQTKHVVKGREVFLDGVKVAVIGGHREHTKDGIVCSFFIRKGVGSGRFTDLPAFSYFKDIVKNIDAIMATTN